MQDYYHFFTVENVQKDQKEIQKVLQGMLDGRLSNDLKVLNYYKEIPVSYDAKIVHMDEDMLELQVHQHQAVVMCLEKVIFLKSSHFPHDVVAKVYKSNVAKCIALLHNFSYAQIRAERRRFVRVQISDPINVNFRKFDLTFDGRLIDVSIGGLSVRSREKIDINLEAAGVLTADLPSGALEMPGRLLKVASEDDSWVYIFEIELNTRIEGAISQFIFQKQVEIIRELKDQLI